jgi:hypothetical protein
MLAFVELAPKYVMLVPNHAKVLELMKKCKNVSRLVKNVQIAA